MDIVRAVTYGRQSHKSESDSQASPLMQKDKGVSYINSQDNWEHTGHYEDVGLSGYDPLVFRPGFEQMMSDARARKFDVVVIYMLSRLTRQGAAEALAIQKELAEHGVALVSTQEPFINTSDDNPFGVAFFALVAGLAHQESRNKSKFIRDAFEKLRERGSHSSGPVPFGFDCETEMVDSVAIRILSPNEGNPGDTVRRVIELAEMGKNQSAITAMMTEEKWETPLETQGEKGEAQRVRARARRKRADDNAPAQWDAKVVGRILRDPRLAGFAIGPVDPKTRTRTILRDEDGQPIRPHKGFISAARWYAIQAMLDGRKRVHDFSRSGDQTLLGSWGISHCGRCGCGMTNDNSRQQYQCNMRRAVGDVPKHAMRIGMAAADEVVARRVWTHLTTLDPVNNERDAELLLVASERFALANTDPEAAAELAEQEAHLAHVQESLTTLYADRSEGLYAGPTGKRTFAETATKYQRFEADTMARIEELRSAASSTISVPLESWLQDGENPLGPESIWERWDTASKRGFLALWVDSVRILPATTTGWASDPELRIEIDWAKPKPQDEDGADESAQTELATL